MHKYLKTALLCLSLGIFHPHLSAFVEDPSADEVIVTYTVDKEKIINPVNKKVKKGKIELQKNTADHQKIWAYFISLIPQEMRKNITKFQISTDGPDETLAEMKRIPKKPNDWILSLDITDSIKNGKVQKSSLSSTIIHEMGHVLTLNPTQVDFDNTLFFHQDLSGSNDYDTLYEEKKSACGDKYYLEEGCSKENSYVNLYYQKFWKDEFEKYTDFVEDYTFEVEMKKGTQLTDKEDLVANEEATALYYKKNPDNFVTEYGASDPGEDIAESWLFFVMLDKPKEEEKIKDKKILFFYDYPELVNYRNQIRASLVKDNLLPWNMNEYQFPNDEDGVKKDSVKK